MATHSRMLAWRIPWTEEPGGLQSIGWQSQTWLTNTFPFFSLFRGFKIYQLILSQSSLQKVDLSSPLLECGPEDLVTCFSWKKKKNAVEVIPYDFQGISETTSELLPCFPSIAHSGRRWLCYKDTQVALKEAHIGRNWVLLLTTVLFCLGQS